MLARAAYALGGLGSGFANTPQELSKLATSAFAHSPQLIIGVILRWFTCNRELFDKFLCTIFKRFWALLFRYLFLFTLNLFPTLKPEVKVIILELTEKYVSWQRNFY